MTKKEFFEGERYQQLIDMLNKKAIYSRDKELVSFHTDIEKFYELNYVKRPVSDGFNYLSRSEDSHIRRCFCKMKDGEMCSLEDIYQEYYPTSQNGLTEDDLLNALEELVANRRKNSTLYTIPDSSR